MNLPKNLNFRRSALIAAGLVSALKLGLWAVSTYIEPSMPALADVVNDSLYLIAAATGVVSDSRKSKET